MAKVSDERLFVLNKAIVGKPFIFDRSIHGDHDKTTLIYLGFLKSSDGAIYKIMSYCWIWGLSSRATPRILIYTANNKYLGNYHLSTINDLPFKIQNNRLIFKSVNDTSHKTLLDRVDFNNGIPKCILTNGSDSCFDKK